MPLLSLPPELRSLIYTHLTPPSPSPSPCYSYPSSACANPLPSHLALLLTNHQLHREVSHHYHLHHHTHLHLASTRIWACNPAHPLSGSLIQDTRPPSYPTYLRLCRNLVIDISTPSADAGSHYAQIAPQIGRVLSHLAVENVYIRLAWPRGRQVEELARLPRRIWDAVEGVGGLGSVVMVLGDWAGELGSLREIRRGGRLCVRVCLRRGGGVRGI